jgi:hypothetical protein
VPTPYETVAEFDTLVKAELACHALLDAGIRAVVEDANPSGLSWDAAATFGTVRLRVPMSDADRAVGVLEDTFGASGERLDELQDQVDG